MTTGRICKRHVDVADAGEPVVTAARRMRDRGVGSLIVVDGAKRPVGILTDRDLALRVVAEKRNPETAKVEDVMTSHPGRVLESTPIDEALVKMRQLGVRRLPVVAENGELQGIVALDDVLSLIAEEIRAVQGVLRVDAPTGALV